MRINRPALCLVIVATTVVLSIAVLWALGKGEVQDALQWPIQGTKAGQTSIRGRIPGGNLGAGLAVGDINGDGTDDLVVGAPFVTEIAESGGKVYVIPGPLALGTSYTVPDRAALIFQGVTDDQPQIGHYTESGDMNGDGYDDIVLGSWRSGRAYLYLGSPSIQSNSPMTIPAVPENMALTTVGATHGLALCDLNADGYQDLFVENNLYDSTQVWGILGSAALTMANPITLSSRADVDIVLQAELPTISSLPSPRHMACGDIDGDGTPDLALGMRGLSPSQRPGAGIVYIVRGDPTITHGTPITLSLPNQAAAIIEGTDGRVQANGDALGMSLAIADVNQDGRGDLIVGAPGASGPDNQLQYAGEVYLWLGRALTGQRFTISDQASWTVHGQREGEVLGSAIAAGDFDGDGHPEILLGCYACVMEKAPSRLHGGGYVLEPLEISRSLTVTAVSQLDLIPDAESPSLGRSTSVLDVDDDGQDELVIGAPDAGYPEKTLPGTVYLIAYPLRNQVFLPLIHK